MMLQTFTSYVASASLSIPMDIEWHIGDVISKLRKGRRLNQTQLAKLVRVNKATIVRAEEGNPKVARQTYLTIADALKTSLAELESEARRLQQRHDQVTKVAQTDTDRHQRQNNDDRENPRSVSNMHGTPNAEQGADAQSPVLPLTEADALKGIGTLRRRVDSSRQRTIKPDRQVRARGKLKPGARKANSRNR